MTTSARFRLGKSAVGTSGPWTWGSYDAPIDASANDYIKAEFETLTGIDTASFEVSSADEVVLAAGVPTVTTVPATRTATFRIGADPACYIVRATANPNAAGAVSSELAVHILTASGLRLVALDETDQASRTYYWLPKLNAMLRTEISVETSVAAVVSVAVSTETATRASADTSLTTRLSTEESAGLSKNASLDTRVSQNASVTTSADASVTTRLSTEESTRLSQVNSLVSGAMPAGTLDQVMQHSGAAWAGRDNLTLPAGAGRTITIAGDDGGATLTISGGADTGAGDVGGDLVLAGGASTNGNGGNTSLTAGSGAVGADDGEFALNDGSSHSLVVGGNAGHESNSTYVRIYASTIAFQVSYDGGGSVQKIGFFDKGPAPVVQQDVGYYGNEDSNLGHCGTTLLALINALVANGLITKHVILA